MRNTAACFAHEVGQHLARSFEVGNDTVEHRRDHSHATCFAPVLLFGFVTDIDHLTRYTIDCNQRWFIDYHTATTHGDNRRGGSHVYRHVIRDEILQHAHSHNPNLATKGTKSTKAQKDQKERVKLI